jgi:hypothetical protein
VPNLCYEPRVRRPLGEFYKGWQPLTVEASRPDRISKTWMKDGPKGNEPESMHGFSQNEFQSSDRWHNLKLGNAKIRNDLHINLKRNILRSATKTLSHSQFIGIADGCHFFSNLMRNNLCCLLSHKACVCTEATRNYCRVTSRHRY